MLGIPPALDTDTEDVAWALQTAEALWRRHERVDALVWLRRAAQAAGEAQHDDRALELARDAAELAEWVQSPTLQKRSGSTSRAPQRTKTVRMAVRAFDVGEATESDDEGDIEEVSVEIAVDSVPTIPNAQQVQSAAEKHAGMLDPWAESDSRPALGTKSNSLSRSSPGTRTFDPDEVVTSAPPIVRAVSASAHPRASILPTNVRSKAPMIRLDLSAVDALSDLPDDAREAFARAAVVRELSRAEEISDFALALILDGSVDLTATIVDTPAHRFGVGGVIRARGTIDRIAPVRLVAASETARVAVWDERAVDEAFRTCPWVEDELRAAGDRLQALVGLTLGPLGERLDRQLRDHVASQLTLRALAEHEVFAARGEPVPGLLVVGAGELELVGDDGAPDGEVLRAGDFLFPTETLIAAPAPSTVRASKGGALVLLADRHAAQELLMTCPPLLEIFAGL
jgi:hypothetical protein